LATSLKSTSMASSVDPGGQARDDRMACRRNVCRNLMRCL
jgi:hypothetical protein